MEQDFTIGNFPLEKLSILEYFGFQIFGLAMPILYSEA
jgi:hypothetical protein